MKRVALVVLIGVWLVCLAPRTYAGVSLLKGAHLATNFNAVLVNQLDLDYMVGTDDVLLDPVVAGVGDLDSEYIQRIPWSGWGMGIYPRVRQLPNFHNKWQALNEPAQWGFTPQQAAQAADSIVSDIVASDPNIDNYIVLDFWSQAESMTWRDAMWDALAQGTKAQIDAIGVHGYFGTSDPKDPRRYMRQEVRPWMNRRGINDAYITEFGFDASVDSQDEVKDYLPLMWDELTELTWIRGATFYSAGGYVPLVKDDHLTKAGRAWKTLP